MLYVGIDLGERKHSVCLLDDDGKVLDEFEVAHNGPELVDLCERLKQLESEQGPVHVGLERPGGAAVALLCHHGFSVFSINPKQVDHYRQFARGSRAKDDRRDAESIAQALKGEPSAFTLVEVHSPSVMGLRRFVSLREDIVGQRSATSNRISGLLRDSLPSLGGLLSLKTQWGVRVLQAVVEKKRPESIHSNTLGRLMKGVRKVSPEEVKEAIQDDLRLIRCQDDWSCLSHHLRLLLKQLLFLNGQLDEVDTEVAGLLDAFEKEEGAQGDCQTFCVRAVDLMRESVPRSR